jgi:hypothetical protein
MLDSDLIQRIRSIFLHAQPYVSIRDAADLLGWSRDEMRGAIGANDIEVTRSCAGDAIEREELLAQVVARWPIEWIEDALAASAAKLLPEGVRTKTVIVRLPRVHATMLAYLAEREGTTEGHLITHALDGLASEHFEKLAASIPGFADALAWPLVQNDEKPC